MQGENFFNFSIFRKNTSEYPKLTVKLCICDNLNQNYRFFLFFCKQFWNQINIENHLENNRMISFVHLWLSFADVKIVCSFFKLSCHNLYVVHASQKEGDCDIIFFLIIYVTVPFYRRKFCDGPIILVFFSMYNIKH